jgi:predicted O-linked N-acetylglucosamine transferase (SPINDLY family)
MNDHILQNAWRLHQAGQFAEAARLYNQVLSANPRHLGALQMLGYLHFQRGELNDADRIMARALKLDPTSVDALYNRGCVLQALGKERDALASFDRALALKPDYAPAMANRGNVLARLGRFADALASYNLALALMPASAELLLNRGNALFELGRHAEALTSYDQALAKEPQVPIVWHNRGNAQAELGRHVEALASFDRAIQLDARYGDAYFGRGAALVKLERDSEALADFEKTLALDPAHLAALHNRGRILRKTLRIAEALAAFEAILAFEPTYTEAMIDKGITLIALKRHAEALAAFDSALTLAPGNVEALTNRASALIRLKRYEEARADSVRATAAEPANAAAWHNLGGALSGLKRPKDALVCLDKALALAPDNGASWNNRGAAMVVLKQEEAALPYFDKALQLDPSDVDSWANRARAHSNLRHFTEAIADSDRALAIDPDLAAAKRIGIHARLHACAWERRDDDKRRITAGLTAGERIITALDHRGLCDSESENLIVARLWAMEEYPPAPNPLWRGERYSHDKIRIAYVSTDFRAHAVAFLIVGSFEHHDKQRFETTAISIHPGDGSETRNRIETAFDRFIDATAMSDAEVAARLKEMEIDIAIDLNGYTGDARTGIFAHRAAPVQVNYLGYPGTMAAPYMDYIIADPITIPAEHRTYYSEKVVYLPNAYQANDRKRRIAERTPTRAECGLPQEGFVFACFNNTHKIGPEIFGIWMRLLRDYAGSVLWLFEDNVVAAQNLRREAAARGVAAERLVFAPRMMPPEHLARTRLADLFLDTLPYNAHTTASDALWMGLPVITCPGTTFPSRVAASLLHAIGMPELVTSSLMEYEDLARVLAKNPERLAAIRATLARNRDVEPMFDTARFTRYLEAAYTGMWEQQQAGRAPESFAVPAEAP